MAKINLPLYPIINDKKITDRKLTINQKSKYYNGLLY